MMQATAAMVGAVAKLDEVLRSILADQMPPVLARAVAAALADTRPMCGKCAVQKADFNRDNADAIQFAWMKACEAAGVEPEDPAALQLQPQMIANLPAELQPDQDDPIHPVRWPVGFPMFTQIAGWGLCVFHVEADAAAAAGKQHHAAPAPEPAQPAVPRKPFLIANSWDVASVAAAARRGMPS